MKKIRSFWSRLCAWAIGLLGFTSVSCDVIEDITGGMMCEYGCPTMDYEIKGTVVDALRGKAIQGISVSRPWDYGDEAVITNAKGEFTFSGQEFPRDTLHILATDIDGNENGTYSEEKVVVNLKKVAKGDGSWYEGKYAASGITVRMEELSSKGE
ncbi:MAG: radical SAM-associated putative lipoprotein [Bacteroidia bacterium]|nr:radical SAM-associated putative lipoprotein [Bacteroidia bacterium]